jgi:cytochrome c2
VLVACTQVTPSAPPAGDADRGRRLLTHYGCVTCHSIPGVSGEHGNVGPPLEGVARRVYIAGFVPNTPDNLMLWIRQPDAIEPLTGMPSLGVSAADARDMAAYLYTLI